jgi:hypothetical protein
MVRVAKPYPPVKPKLEFEDLREEAIREALASDDGRIGFEVATVKAYLRERFPQYLRWHKQLPPELESELSPIERVAAELLAKEFQDRDARAAK